MDVVVVAEEFAAEVPVRPCLGRLGGWCLQRFRGFFLPSAQAIRAKMGICSEPQWRKWLPTLVPCMAMKLPRNGPAERRSLSPSLPILMPYGIGMRHGSKRPESELSYGSRVRGLRRRLLKPNQPSPYQSRASQRTARGRRPDRQRRHQAQ